jgi:hypothetical protein
MSGNDREQNTSTSKVPVVYRFLSPEFIPLYIGLCIGTIARIYLAFTAPINMDENFYAFDAHLLSNGLTPFTDFPTRSPLMILLGAAIYKLGGDFFVLRMVAVLFSIATGILIYFTGRIMGGNRIGTIAALLFLLSPYSIRYGYVFFTQPVEAFFVGLSFYLIVRWVRDHDMATGNGGIQNGCQNEKTVQGVENGSPETPESFSIFHALYPHRELLLSGIILGMAVFIRRNAMAFFPAGLLILAYYQITLRNKDIHSWHRSVLRNPIPLIAFSIGFLSILIPGILIFMKISGLSFTTYFFFSDYLQAHTSTVGNIEFILLYYDTRGFYFISLGMLFLTMLLLKLPILLSEHFGWTSLTRDRIYLAVKGFLLLGWILASVAMLGSNYNDGQEGDIFTEFGLGFVILCAPSLYFGSLLLRRRKLSKPFGIAGVQENGILEQYTQLYQWITVLSAVLVMSREGYFFPFGAIIILNLLCILAFFLFGKVHRNYRFNQRSSTDFPSPLAATGIFFIGILLFYILFRILLPYFYDVLFPLCILSAFLLNAIGNNISAHRKDILEIAKVLFFTTLVLSSIVSVMEFQYRDSKANETEIDDFRAAVDFLEDVTVEGEIIFTAKASIAYQADVENLHNIVRPAPYLDNDTDLLERLEYPTIGEIITGLDDFGVRFIVVDFVMQTYFLDAYPELGTYVSEQYSRVKICGDIYILGRNKN